LATNGTSTIVPPQNLEAEESVLGAMMVSESTIEPVLLDVRLHAEDFYRDRTARSTRRSSTSTRTRAPLTS
jgi:Replicative DNA helicase